jgi:hypothetical protein
MKTCHSYGSRSHKQEKIPHKERGGLKNKNKKPRKQKEEHKTSMHAP